MNIIEIWFNISPDGGDGVLELVLVGGFLLSVAIAVFRSHPWQRPPAMRVREADHV